MGHIVKKMGSVTFPFKAAMVDDTITISLIHKSNRNPSIYFINSQTQDIIDYKFIKEISNQSTAIPHAELFENSTEEPTDTENVTKYIFGKKTTERSHICPEEIHINYTDISEPYTITDPHSTLSALQHKKLFNVDECSLCSELVSLQLAEPYFKDDNGIYIMNKNNNSQLPENSLHRRCFVKLCIAGSLVLENIDRDIKKHIFASKI